MPANLFLCFLCLCVFFISVPKKRTSCKTHNCRLQAFEAITSIYKVIMSMQKAYSLHSLEDTRCKGNVVWERRCERLDVWGNGSVETRRNWRGGFMWDSLEGHPGFTWGSSGVTCGLLSCQSCFKHFVSICEPSLHRSPVLFEIIRIEMIDVSFPAQPGTGMPPPSPPSRHFECICFRIDQRSTRGQLWVNSGVVWCSVDVLMQIALNCILL